MKPLINLSSAPFRNRRLFWLGIAALFLVASYFGLKAIGTKSWMEQEIALRQSRINELRTRFAKVEKPAPTGAAAISQDQNLQLLAANELIERRAFSWTQLLNDLERGLPPTVRVLRVGVAAATEDDRAGASKNAAVLSMTVIGKSEGDVTTMITRLIDSGRFKVFPLSKKPVEGMEDVEFTLQVQYYPPERAASPNQPNQVAVVEKPQP